VGQFGRWNGRRKKTRSKEREKERKKGIDRLAMAAACGTLSATTTTPFVVVGVMYYLELRDVRTSYFTFQFLQTKIK
jgi:hypothetical protein